MPEVRGRDSDGEMESHTHQIIRLNDDMHWIYANPKLF